MTNPKRGIARVALRLLPLVFLFGAGFGVAYLWQFTHRSPSRAEVTRAVYSSPQDKAETASAVSAPVPLQPKAAIGGAQVPTVPKVALQPPTSLHFTPKSLFAHLAPSVFLVETLDQRGTVIAQGSGVVVEDDLVVTNIHVIRGVQRGGSLKEIRNGLQPLPIWTLITTFVACGPRD